MYSHVLIKFISTIVFTIALTAGSVATAAKPPNVIFILMDDMGYSDVSCYGATKVKTPHIDRLAADGLRFTDFHTGASICSPSRAAFLTGAYPQRCGLYMGINENREPHWFLGLNPDEITIAEQFKKMNYTTLMIGKWHLGSEEKFSYFNQGFDQYYGAPSNMGHNPEFLDGKKLIYKNTPLEKLTSLYTARITEHVASHKDKPFFLYYAHNYPHTPYKPGPNFKGTSKDGIRGDCIQEVDWSIGEIVKALDTNGILDNTIIIFTSDNGPTKATYSKPYSGTKYVSLEGGHRVPFIIYWKGGITNPEVINVPVNAMDLFPTLSEVIGAPLPADRVYDGVSLTPLFKQQPIARKTNTPFLYYNCENLQAIRVGNWKLHLPREAKQMPWWDKGDKQIASPRLYNLETDKAEKNDVATKHPEVVTDILKLVDPTRASLGEYPTRGSDQRATGSLFPGVPVLSHTRDWDALPDAIKGKANTSFAKETKAKRAPRKKRQRTTSGIASPSFSAPIHAKETPPKNGNNDR